MTQTRDWLAWRTPESITASKLPGGEKEKYMSLEPDPPAAVHIRQCDNFFREHVHRLCHERPISRSRFGGVIERDEVTANGDVITVLAAGSGLEVAMAVGAGFASICAKSKCSPTRMMIQGRCPRGASPILVRSLNWWQCGGGLKRIGSPAELGWEAESCVLLDANSGANRLPVMVLIA
jgi:hypothetical protein